MNKGILLLALGHANYGKMSAALAAMLKATGTTIPIHLAYTESAVKGLADGEKALFDSMEVIPEKYYTWKGELRYIMAKMYLLQLSPYKETLYLDSDIAWLNKQPEELFSQLQEVALTFANSGEQKESVWADVEAVKSAYNIDKVLGIHSELVYFKKEESVKRFFRTAQDIYKSLKVPATVFAGAIPDELPFMIATELTGIQPHQTPFYPLFWYKRDKKMLHNYQIAKDYYGFSMGGNVSMRHEMEMYNNATKAAYYKWGLKYPYQWQQKQLFLKERQNY